jgi:hypothetical protein
MDTNLVTVIAAAVAAAGTSSKSDPALSVILAIAIALIAAIPPTLVAMAGLFKSREALAVGKETHLSINSRLDKWLIAEHNQGVAAGRQQVIGETADAAAAAVLVANKAGVAPAKPIPLIPAEITLSEPQVSRIVDELMRALEGKPNKE